ncbi:SMI1/KNR4 family protein [Macrococcus capreoli]
MKFNFDSYIEKSGEELINEDIEKFESWRGYKLPKDFVKFTLKYPFAHMSAEFDADGRPNSMISNMLKFSKEGNSSIYVDEAYEIKDFGPYVLFGEDPGGNYIAFNYSTDELNPSVVFIDHEELGIVELPEVTAENDFTEEELDKMMSSEKLEDFPWAIHNVASSFSEFINDLRFEGQNNLIKPSDFEFIQEQFDEINSIYNKKILDCIEYFFKKYSGWDLQDIKFNSFSLNINLDSVLNFNNNDFFKF